MKIRIVAVFLALALGACAYEPPTATDEEGNEVQAVAVGPDGEPISAGDAIQMAGNARALSMLQRANIAAQTYFAETGTLADFTPEVAALHEPGITWNASSTVIEGQVSIRDPQVESVVFVVDAGLGGEACAVTDATNATVRYGQSDAVDAASCTGEVDGFEDVGGAPPAPPEGYPSETYPENGYPQDSGLVPSA